MIHIENTTIEEQIAYEKDFAKFCLEQAEKWKNKDLDEYGYHMKTYRESTNKYRWLEELKSHREAWEGLRHDVYELHEILFNMKPQHRTTTVAGDILDLINAYRPKEGDSNADID